MTRPRRCEKCRADITDGGDSYRCEACATKATGRRLLRVRRILDRRTPDRYTWSYADAAELPSRVKPRAAIDRAFAVPAAQSVVFIGPSGAGKTSLARATWSERALGDVQPVGRSWSRYDDDDTDDDADSLRVVSALFATTFEVAKARREHRLGSGEAELIDRVIRVRHLVIDELGAEASRGDSAVAEVIHERHAAQRATIYTTPFGLDELATKYSDGIARRIFEGAVVVRLGGKNG